MPDLSLIATLDSAYTVSTTLQEATEKMYRVQKQLHEAQTTLRDERDVILREFAADPKPLGVNEAAREAALRGRTANAQRRVDVAEYELLTARQQTESAKHLWEFAKFSLRLMEAAAQMPKQEAE